MFGMLDYRAHKLYWLLSLPIFVPITLLTLFGLPFAIYAIGFNYGSERIWQAAISIGAILPADLAWTLVVLLIAKVFDGAFYFLIDVEPVGGRTTEEAKVVVKGGDAALHALALEKPAETWTDEMINAIAKGDIFGRMFYKRRRERTYAVRDYYIANPNTPITEYNTKKFMKEANLSPSIIEHITSNPMFRGWFIRYGFLLGLLLMNPLAS